tara:strand:- start:24 stop:824 length:801 start_codon:yes stop_codon:yes gene_type:complete
MSSNPIGIFDSGIGGLTIAHAIKKKLPNENIIYFGDTKHLPYGEKSKEAIKYYSLKIAQFLIDNNCKTIIIACNSASSVAFDYIKNHVSSVPIFNVIDPIIDDLTKKNEKKIIGVIGTKATIKSNIYQKKINQKNQSKVISLETPLLAPMIEEGFFNQEISLAIIRNYLSNKNFKQIDSLILACTHYPLIKKQIKEFFNDNVNVIDSSLITVNYIKQKLKKLELLNTRNKASYNFIVSSLTESFSESASYFFKEKIMLKEKDIWKQ